MKITNAVQLRPLMFRKATGRWQYIDQDLAQNDRADNLPLGVEGSTIYQTSELSVESDDLLLLYTDAFTEACGSGGKQLGEAGLLSLVQSLSSSISFDQFGRELLSSVRTCSRGVSCDDETLMVIRFGQGRGSPGIMERLRGYAEVLCHGSS